MSSRCIIFGACVAIVMGFALIPEEAESQGAKIGQVASLRKEAARSGKPLRMGDPVFSNDVITTGADSSVRITFSDDTNLALGPTSRVVLDRFVFSGAPEFAISATRGAIRFTSGNLPKTAYSVKTPTATMGVRGTIVEIAVGSRGDRYTVIRP